MLECSDCAAILGDYLRPKFYGSEKGKPAGRECERNYCPNCGGINYALDCTFYHNCIYSVWKCL